MGVMIEGKFIADDPGPDTTLGGEFKRTAATIRGWITDPDPARYQLFVAWNCPWAHRTLLMRALLDLNEITLSYAAPRRTDQGWVYEAEGPYSDKLLGVRSVHEVYARHEPPYTGRLTVPVLWDKTEARIISNESADIIQMFGRERLCPPDLKEEIERWNALIYRTVNNGVYRAGFARTQEAYDAAVFDLFDTLDQIETRLSESEWLTGDRFTEADLRLFPTLARFDVAYHYAFKCNIRRLVDYPNLWRYARRIYAMPGVAGTVNFEIYKRGYFSPSELRNPLGIVPAGPVVDWSL